MRPRTWRGWAAVVLVLIGGVVVARLFLVAFVQAVHLVDMVPGADAGVATSPELEAARGASTVWGLVLLGLGVGTAAVLLRLELQRQRLLTGLRGYSAAGRARLRRR